MVELRGDLDLTEETLRAECCRQLRAQDLQGYLPVELEVFDEVDGRHAAGAEFALDTVAVPQCGGEAFRRASHMQLPRSSVIFRENPRLS